MDNSINEEKWFNDLERRCHDILDDALNGYPDYLWMGTYQEDYLDELHLDGDCITEFSLEIEIQSGNDFGFPILTNGLVCFRYLLTKLDDIPSVYGYFFRDGKQIEFTIEPLYIDTMNKIFWILELDKEGWYNI